MDTKRARRGPQWKRPDGFSKAGSGRGTQTPARRCKQFDAARLGPTIVASVRPEQSEDNPNDESWFDRMVEPFDPPAEEDDVGSGPAREAEEYETEARQAKAATIPARPSQKEVDNHMLTHLPYRAWCPHCVRGKAKGKPHPRDNDDSKTIPTVVLEYMFMHEYQESGEERGMPILLQRTCYMRAVALA